MIEVRNDINSVYPFGLAQKIQYTRLNCLQFQFLIIESASIQISEFPTSHHQAYTNEW